MMVPASRLLWWVGFGGLPFATAAGLLPEAAPFCCGVLTLLAGAVATDAWLGRRRRPRVETTAPVTVRLPVGRVGRLPLVATTVARDPGQIVFGLPWPDGVRAHPETVVVPVSRGESQHRLNWDCTALRRGVSALEAAYVESGSPWGLWRVRQRLRLGCEVRAYPDLLGERRQVAALFLNRGGFGIHAQRMVGRGREFEKLREYAPGDSYEDIHWKSTAKRGRPVTKLYQMERTQEVYVLLDISRLSGRPAPSAAGLGRDSAESNGEPAVEPAVTTVLERFMTASLVLALAAARQGDLFGLVTFSDQVHAFLRARNGRAHFQACRDLMLRLEPRAVAPDFDEVFTFVRLRLRRRALLVVLTGLDDPVLSEDFGRGVELVQRQHLVVVNLLRPAGVEPMFTQPQVPSVEALYEVLAGHLRWHSLRELQQALHHRGIRLALLEQEQLSADLVRQYLEVKRRQQL